MPGFKEVLETVRKAHPSLSHVFEQEALFQRCFGHNPELDDKNPEELLQYYYESLLRGILAQQISGAAATSIIRKFKLLFRTPEGLAIPDKPVDYDSVIPTKDEADKLKELDASLKFPSPDLVIKTPPDLLRSAGLSVRKAEYVVCLSQAVVDEKLTYDLFTNGTDDEIVDALVAIKGIGPWSADMFLLFGLRRLNVFSIGDLGIQRGVSVYLSQSKEIRDELAAVDWAAHEAAREPGTSARARDRKVAKKAAPSSSTKKDKWKVPDKNTMEFIANKYTPYRSVLMLALWHLSAIDLNALDSDKA